LTSLLAYKQPDGSIDFRPNAATCNSIKGGVYRALNSMDRGIYLSPTTEFKYLDEYFLLDDFEELVLESFNQSNKSLAVLYLGLKGSGKTKRAHKLALDSGMPVLIIDNLDIINSQKWNDIVGSDALNNWIIFVDEYEKKLDNDNSVALLNWLDGSVSTKQLFILIGNEQAKTKYSDPLLDRLSRVLWKKEFTSLTDEQVETLVNKLSKREEKSELLDLLSNIPVLSMDNTMQIIRITNMFPNKSIESLLNKLNISFNSVEDFTYVDEFYKPLSYGEDNIGLTITRSGPTINSARIVRFYIEHTNIIERFNSEEDDKKIYRIQIEVPGKDIKLVKVSRFIYKFEAPYNVCYSYEEWDDDKWQPSNKTMTVFLYKTIAWNMLNNPNSNSFYI
jgi:adenylate kinase family enzyme